VYVALQNSDLIVPVNTITLSTGSTISVGSAPYDMTIDSSNRLYVTNSSDSTISVINTTTNTVVKTISSIGGGAAGIDYDTTTTKVYVSNGISGSVVVLCT
jgi:YVTN family beta-propeller protein